MSLLDQLSAAKRAVGSMLDASRGWRAARQAYDDGESIPDCVAAFAAETDNDLDDQAAEHLATLLTNTARGARELSVNLIRLKHRVDYYAPKVQSFIDEAVKYGTKIGDQADDLLNRGDNEQPPHDS